MKLLDPDMVVLDSRRDNIGLAKEADAAAYATQR